MPSRNMYFTYVHMYSSNPQTQVREVVTSPDPCLVCCCLQYSTKLSWGRKNQTRMTSATWMNAAPSWKQLGKAHSQATPRFHEKLWEWPGNETKVQFNWPYSIHTDSVLVAKQHTCTGHLCIIHTWWCCQSCSIGAPLQTLGHTIPLPHELQGLPP